MTEQAARAIVRERSGGLCEVGAEGVCTLWARHVHHRLRGNPRVHDPAEMLDTCPECHEHLHSHPVEAYERGWLRHRAS